MLERASTCLESGGRQLLRAPKPCLRSRRMLHSSFWQHGASDLALPAWWAPSSTIDHAADDINNPARSKPATRSHEGPLLDFLYPEKTLAFMRRLSTYGTDTADSRRRAVLATGARQYSTSQWQPPTEGQLDDLESIQAKEKMDELLFQSTPAEALRKILWSNEKGKQELVWHLYSALDEPAPSVDFLCDILEYLGEADFTHTSNRILQVFDRVPPQHRRAASCRLAITAYVALKMVGPAIQLLEEASEHFDPARIGIDVVLGRTIQDDQWDLSIRVFKMFLKAADRNHIKVDEWRGYGWVHDEHWTPIFGQARHVLQPVERFRSFLDHVRQFHHELNSTEENKRALHLFVHGYVPGVMSEVLNTPEPDEDYIYKFFTRLFRDLRRLELPTWALYDYAIPTILNIPRYQSYTHERKIFVDLYLRWRKEHFNGYCKPPSRRVMNKLIIQFGRHLGYDRVNKMVEDLRLFHAPDPFNAAMLYYLINFYANGGLVDRVHEFFQILQTEFASKVDLRILTALTYVYARRNDVSGALQQFRRITTEFKLVPDTACWNVLLLAFTRADDLDGALECFNNCLESGVKPDLYTFGPMLDLCASRGDVEAFEALFSRAKQLNVPVETNRRARSGYVEVFLNAGDAEGAEQIAQSILHSWRAGTFGDAEITHVWNLLIHHYAVAGDLTETRRLYNEMIANKIPLDSWTYGGLMRAMVETKHTNAAFKILRVTMPQNNIRVYAFHHALVISGFLRQSQFRRAKAAYMRMKFHGVSRKTPSLRQMELLYMGTRDLLKLRARKIKDPRARLISIEEGLRHSLMSDYGHEIASDEPKFNRYIDSPELSNIPKSYFSILIMLYTARGAYDIAKELFAKASRGTVDEHNYTAPIALLTAIMETHFKAGEHAEVEHCWKLARKEATRLVKTFHHVMHPEPPMPEFNSITDPSVLARFEASRIALNRRQTLFKALRIYIRSLCAQNTSETLQQAQRTMHNLLSNGFLVDNLTWNEFIQHLATRNRVLDAFSACEMYLMPYFPGWAALSPTYIRHYRPGYAWMELRHYEVKRTSILPRYKTLVILAAAYARVRRDEANGVGFNPHLGGWAREKLEQVAPLTVRAIETMPKTGDYLQKRHLAEM